MPEMNDYVRKEVFDARMDRMEMLLEKTITEIKTENAKFREEMKAENAKFREEINAKIDNVKTELNEKIDNVKTELNGRIDGLTVEINGVKQEIGGLKTEISELKNEVHDVKNETRFLSVRIDSQENVLYWGLGGFGIILASAVIIPAVVAFIKKLFTPSVTLEDMERIAKEVTARAIAELQGGRTE